MGILPLKQFFDIVDLTQYQTDMLEEVLSFLRGDHSAVCPLENGKAQICLQFPDITAQVRLGNIQRFRSLVDGAITRHLHCVLDLKNVHIRSSFRSRFQT